MNGDNIVPIRPDPNVGTQGIEIDHTSRAYRVGFGVGVALIPLGLAALVALVLWVVL